METLTHKNKLIIFFAIVLTILLFASDLMIMTPSLPRILEDIGGLQYINWVFTAFALAQTVTAPIYGKLSDVFSRKRMFLLAIVIFVFSSMMAGFSRNIYELITARAIQGIGGGAIMVTAMSMIGEIFSIKERAKYQGFMGGIFAFSSVASPTLGAIITDEFSWRWIFFINFPIAVIAFLIIYFYLPKKLHQAKNVKIDYKGSVLLVTTLLPLLLSFSFIENYKTVTFSAVLLFVFSLISLFVFLSVEKKVTSPIFSHHLFKDRDFVIPAFITFVSGIVMFSVMLYIQIYAQKILNFSLKESGLIMSAIAVPIALTSPIYGNIIARTLKYKKVIVTGAFILFVSVLDFSYTIWNGGMTGREMIFHLIPLGIGLGAMMSVFNIVLQMIYGRERLGEVMGSMQLVRGVGNAFGAAFMGFIFSLFVVDINGDTNQIVNGVTNIFYIASFLCVLAFIASLFIKEKKL